MNVEAIFRYVDADEDGALFVHNPTLQMRARARAAVRVWDCGGGDRNQALSRAFEPQADAGWPPPLASPVSFRRATQTYKAERYRRVVLQANRGGGRYRSNERLLHDPARDRLASRSTSFT